MVSDERDSLNFVYSKYRNIFISEIFNLSQRQSDDVILIILKNNVLNLFHKLLQHLLEACTRRRQDIDISHNGQQLV